MCVCEGERELERESSEEGVTDTLSGCNYNWTGEREREKCDVETNKGIKKKYKNKMIYILTRKKRTKTKWFICQMSVYIDEIKK